ncbi:Fanconi-associated nuclease-like protein [Zancudomyces culisetae]|uniref:Fanconi-associated nuclease n=1 Tax=Zancudomyces culisetae TaxID=1213189 RepID=A0A1R1PTK5_ZANCU|nr:Fanconi-associated nuclease-like protein [Zancudomyces culisetae]|eukprot:OMH84222.1 Fanconi-associated nuclease-like protein [Zancudomyces culisetae]
MDSKKDPIENRDTKARIKQREPLRKSIDKQPKNNGRRRNQSEGGSKVTLLNYFTVSHAQGKEEKQFSNKVHRGKSLDSLIIKKTQQSHVLSLSIKKSTSFTEKEDIKSVIIQEESSETKVGIIAQKSILELKLEDKTEQNTLDSNTHDISEEILEQIKDRELERENSPTIVKDRCFDFEKWATANTIDFSQPDLNTTEASQWSDGKKGDGGGYMVDVFETILRTVLKEESYLFCKNEIKMFKKYFTLSMEARCLFVRLNTRRNKWISVKSINYREVRDVERAVDELRDVYYDELDECEDTCDGASDSCGYCSGEEARGRKQLFDCRNVLPLISCGGDDIDELSELISVEKLKNICKEVGVSGERKMKRQEIMEEMKKVAKKQQNISGFFRNTSSSSRRESVEVKIRNRMQSMVGKAIKVNPNSRALMERVNLIFGRIYSPRQGFSNDSSLGSVNKGENNTVGYGSSIEIVTAMVLKKMGKMNYPNYKVTRSSTMFKSRQAVLDFKYMMDVEAYLENVANNGELSNISDGGSKVLIKDEDPTSRWRYIYEITKPLMKVWDLMVTEKMERWKNMEKKEKGNDDKKTKVGNWKRRLTAGWVLTRIVENYIMKSMATLKDFKGESEILKKLLEQKWYRRVKEGKWYKRLALIQYNYLFDSEANSIEVLLECRDTCIRAILNSNTSVFDLKELGKRLANIDKKLNTPEELQLIINFPAQKTPNEVSVCAYKVGNPYSKRAVWKNLADDSTLKTVEEIALDYYHEAENISGFHSENSILNTLFVILFWDIIFSPVEGMFDSEFQTHPLDMYHCDSFYALRKDLIDRRIKDIMSSDGNSSRVHSAIRAVYLRESRRNTICIGVSNWNYYSADVLCELVTLLGPSALAEVCIYLASDYKRHSSGMPDICAWNIDSNVLVFSEGSNLLK